MIIDLLQIDDWYNVSETVEIAKGKYELPLTFKDGFKQVLRQWRYKKQ